VHHQYPCWNVHRHLHALGVFAPAVRGLSQNCDGVVDGHDQLHFVRVSPFLGASFGLSTLQHSDASKGVCFRPQRVDFRCMGFLDSERDAAVDFVLHLW
jgi:hypothetical protein